MRYALLMVLLAARFGTAADEDHAYYPTKVGTKWTYKVDGMDDRIEMSIAKTMKVGKQDRFEIEAKTKEMVVATEVAAVLEDGVYRYKSNQIEFDPPVCFLKANAKKGTIWTHDFKIKNMAGTARFEVAEPEDIEVTSGKYAGTIVVHGEIIFGAGTDKKQEMKNTCWYAKNVGMVKQVMMVGDSKIIIELEKMEEPKKQ